MSYDLYRTTLYYIIIMHDFIITVTSCASTMPYGTDAIPSQWSFVLSRYLNLWLPGHLHCCLLCHHYILFWYHYALLIHLSTHCAWPITLCYWVISVQWLIMKLLWTVVPSHILCDITLPYCVNTVLYCHITVPYWAITVSYCTISWPSDLSLCHIESSQC